MSGVGGVRWLDETEKLMWRGYLDSTRLLFRELDHQLTRDAGLSLVDFEILVIVSEAAQQRCRMSEIAEAMTTTRGGVTRAVSRLVDSGWVRRCECGDDKRGTWAELTDEGAAKLAEAAPGHVAVVRRFIFDLLNPGDADRFARLYSAICDELRDAAGHGPAETSR